MLYKKKVFVVDAANWNGSDKALKNIEGLGCEAVHIDAKSRALEIRTPDSTTHYVPLNSFVYFDGGEIMVHSSERFLFEHEPNVLVD